MPNNLINWLKYYVLQLGDPYPYLYPSRSLSRDLVADLPKSSAVEETLSEHWSLQTAECLAVPEKYSWGVNCELQKHTSTPTLSILPLRAEARGPTLPNRQRAAFSYP